MLLTLYRGICLHGNKNIGSPRYCDIQEIYAFLLLIIYNQEQAAPRKLEIRVMLSLRPWGERRFSFSDTCLKTRPTLILKAKSRQDTTPAETIETEKETKNMPNLELFDSLRWVAAPKPSAEIWFLRSTYPILGDDFCAKCPEF